MKYIITIGLSILLFGLLFSALRTGREMKGTTQLKGGSFINGLRIIQKKQGIPVWTLSAKKAELLESGAKAELHDITMTIQKSGLVLYTNRGTYNLSEQNFTAKGVMRAEAKDYTIKADSMKYETASGNINTDGSIILEGKGFKIEGRGMEAIDGQKVSILHDVKATFNK